MKTKRKMLKSSNRQTGTSVLEIDRQLKALPPGKRMSENGNVYYEYRKNRTDLPVKDSRKAKRKSLK